MQELLSVIRRCPLLVVSQATTFTRGGRVWSNSHHDFVPRSVQLACAKVGANSNLIVAAIIRDVVMTCTYTARHMRIIYIYAYGTARRGAGLTLAHSAIALMDTSIRYHWSHPLSWRLTRQENRGMQQSMHAGTKS